MLRRRLGLAWQVRPWRPPMPTAGSHPTAVTIGQFPPAANPMRAVRCGEDLIPLRGRTSCGRRVRCDGLLPKHRRWRPVSASRWHKLREDCPRAGVTGNSTGGGGAGVVTPPAARDGLLLSLALPQAVCSKHGCILDKLEFRRVPALSYRIWAILVHFITISLGVTYLACALLVKVTAHNVRYYSSVE